MILGENISAIGGSGHGTIDELFRRAALRRSAEWALIDPPNRRAFADGAPRYVSYAAADRFVSALAGRLHRLELPRDSIVAIQCMNIVESTLSLLGVLRAGMIAAPLPLLWRRDDMVPALGRIGPKAIIAAGRIGSNDLSDVAMHAAAELFSIRYVCGFGEKLADGVIPLGELFTDDRLDPIVSFERRDNAAARIAVITWDTNAQGHVPVARNHAELIAGGMAVLLEGQIQQDASLLAAPTFGSFASLALTIMPWLLAGGTLVLHQPFDPKIFAEQCVEHRCDTVAVPGPLLTQLLEAGLLANANLRNALAVWRSPERLAKSPRWTHPNAGLVDVQAFGEVGLIATRREALGLPEPMALGPVKAPHGAEDAVTIAEIARSDVGTLALRGPMVPRHPFPPGSKPGDAPALQADAIGYVDTGYPCRIERKSVELSGPPAGLVSVGGYRFVQRAMQERVGKEATIAALPDAILSHRHAGSAGDRAAVQQALAARGVNPLLVGAFRDRRKHPAT